VLRRAVDVLAAAACAATPAGLRYPHDMRVKTRQQERRALAERAANAAARAAGLPLPFPNPWDALDPTKVPRDATPEQIQQSYRAFNEMCRPRPCKRYEI
jgi:hypothetical protein